jgi:STE24 endopeptidase
VTVCVQLWLTTLNVRHQRRHGNEVPPEFADSIDTETLKKSSAYNADREALGILQTLFSAAIVLWFLFGGGLAAYDHWVGQLVSGRLWQGILFFAGLMLGSSVLELPFGIYSTFRIEQRHGFNRTNAGLFFADLLKGTLLSLVLVAGITAAGLGLYYVTPNWYWLWFWGFGIVLVVLLMLVAPYVIEPCSSRPRRSPMTHSPSPCASYPHVRA